MLIFTIRNCDIKTCTSDTSEYFVFHGCCHSYHVNCVSGEKFCRICGDFLKAAMVDFTKRANHAIFKDQQGSKETDSTDINQGFTSQNESNQEDEELQFDGDFVEENNLQLSVDVINNEILSWKN